MLSWFQNENFFYKLRAWSTLFAQDCLSDDLVLYISFNIIYVPYST